MSNAYARVGLAWVEPVALPKATQRGPKLAPNQKALPQEAPGLPCGSTFRKVVPLR